MAALSPIIVRFLPAITGLKKICFHHAR
jgi:hypothetical protein